MSRNKMVRPEQALRRDREQGLLRVPHPGAATQGKSELAKDFC